MATGTTDFSISMIPALDTLSPEPKIGDVAAVPAVRTQLSHAGKSIQCVGLIDTAAEMCVLDQSLFERLSDAGTPGKPITLRLSMGTNRASVYDMAVSIDDPKSGQQLRFENVPVAVAPLKRRMFVIGRRGILEWLRVEFDFPRQMVRLVAARAGETDYPHLSQEFPALSNAIELFGKGRVAEGVMLLAWDMERYVDRLTSAAPHLALSVASIATRNRSLGEKLLTVCRSSGMVDMSDDVNQFVRARNIAAHGQLQEDTSDVNTCDVLASAERIVSRLAALPQAKRFLIQMTVRESDQIDSNELRRDIKNLGGQLTNNGFEFSTRSVRDEAVDQLARRFGKQSVTAVDQLSD